MIVGCLIAAIVLLAGSGALQIREIRRTNERIDDFDRALSDFFTSRDTDKMSPFTQIVDQVTNIVAEKQALVTQASIRGAMGGQQRAMNKQFEDIAKEENPALAMADAVLPKSLKKNNMALMGFQSVISKLFQGGSGSAGGDNHSEQARFHL